jgi:hypothetical protein
MSSRPLWATLQDLFSKNKNKQEGEGWKKGEISGYIVIG